MNEPSHHVLLLEDCPNDVYLTRILLRGIASILSVDNRKDYEKAIGWKFDLILADMRVPGFSGFEALAISKKSKRPETPFIYLSGSVNDEILAQAMKHGAHDCIQKDRVARLEFVIKRLFGLPL